MNSLVADVVALRNSEVGDVVRSRLREFREVGSCVPSCLFRELCFCLITANCSAESCLLVLEEISDGFLLLSEAELSHRLKELGYRFPNRRASFIVEARACVSLLEGVLSSGDSKEIREWLVDNVKGLGLKEASHFLRNVGFFDVAIVDFHIVDLLVGRGLIKRPRYLSKRRYLEVEGVLQRVADKADMSLGELDLYLWYLETGKVLK